MFIVIQALVKASGETGLEAFLPSSTRLLSSLAGKITPSEGDVPHLPLVSHWLDGKYALREVMGSARDVRIRDWTLRLLQRYRFVIGMSTVLITIACYPCILIVIAVMYRRDTVVFRDVDRPVGCCLDDTSTEEGQCDPFVCQ